MHLQFHEMQQQTGSLSGGINPISCFLMERLIKSLRKIHSKNNFSLAVKLLIEERKIVCGIQKACYPLKTTKSSLLKAPLLQYYLLQTGICIIKIVIPMSPKSHSLYMRNLLLPELGTYFSKENKFQKHEKQSPPTKRKSFSGRTRAHQNPSNQ